MLLASHLRFESKNPASVIVTGAVASVIEVSWIHNSSSLVCTSAQRVSRHALLARMEQKCGRDNMALIQYSAHCHGSSAMDVFAEKLSYFMKA